MQEKKFYTMKEVSEILGCAYLTVWGLCNRKELPSKLLGNKRYIPIKAIKKLEELSEIVT